MIVRIFLLSGEDIVSQANQVLFMRIRGNNRGPGFDIHAVADMLLNKGGDIPAWDVFNLLTLANLHRCVARMIANINKPLPMLSGWTSVSHHLEASSG